MEDSSKEKGVIAHSKYNPSIYLLFVVCDTCLTSRHDLASLPLRCWSSPVFHQEKGLGLHVYCLLSCKFLFTDLNEVKLTTKDIADPHIEIDVNNLADYNKYVSIQWLRYRGDSLKGTTTAKRV